nr:cytochrome c oxidase subunit Vb:COX4 [Hymenolepis microstoma]
MASRILQSLIRARFFSSSVLQAPANSVYSRVRNFIINNEVLKSDGHKEPKQTLSKMQKELLEQIEEVDINYREFKVRDGGKTTENEPNLIPFDEERRMVGCICHEDNHHISYLLLYKGLTTRCKCGHWFKLVDFNEYEAARDRYWKKIEREPENQKLMNQLNDAEAEMQRLLDVSKDMTGSSPGSTEIHSLNQGTYLILTIRITGD